MNGNYPYIKLMINDQPARLESIQLRGMNFGQSCPELPTATYTLIFPLTYLTDCMADFYHEFVQDDLVHGTGGYPDPVLRMRRLGWPSLERLAQIDPSLFISFVRDHLAFDFLCLIHGRFSQNPKYIINSVDHVEVKDTEIWFSGVVLEVEARPH